MTSQSPKFDVKGRLGVLAHIYPERIVNNKQLLACLCILGVLATIGAGIVATVLAVKGHPISSALCVIITVVFLWVVANTIIMIANVEDASTTGKLIECESDEERAKELIRQETADRIRKEELELARRKCALAGIK